jgi:hypothetical protein
MGGTQNISGRDGKKYPRIYRKDKLVGKMNNEIRGQI